MNFIGRKLGAGNSDRIMLIKLVAGKIIVTILMVYALHADLNVSVKDLFYENLKWTLTKISASKILFVCGDFNGHIKKNVDAYDGICRMKEFLNLLSPTT